MLVSHRRAAALMAALLAAVVVGSGCGGDDERAASPATTPGDATMSAEVRERIEKNLPAPEVQAQNLLQPQLEPLLTYLHFDWGTKPTEKYSATKEAPARWRVRARFAGDDAGERLSAEWLMYVPLDRAPTDAELARADRDDSIEAVDAGARKLDVLPPVIPGNTASLSGTLKVDGKAFALAVDDEQVDSSERVRRAMKALGTSKDLELRVVIGRTTRIKNAQGDRLSASQLRRAVADLNGFGPPAFISWKLDHPVRTRADLEGEAAATVMVITP